MILANLGVLVVSFFALSGLAMGSNSLPSVPTNLTIVDLQSRSIDVTWTSDGNSAQLNYTVYYKMEYEKDVREVEVVGVTKATLSVKPYRKCEIFVAAGNEHGYGLLSNKTISNETLESVPESCPKVIQSDERLNDTLTIIWEPVPEKDRNGIIEGYVIFYMGKNMTEFKNVTVNDPTATVYDLHNMAEEQNYGFKVAAFTSKGLCKGYQYIELEHELATPTTTRPVPLPATTPLVPTTTPLVPTTTPLVPTTTPLVPTTTQLVPTTTGLVPATTGLVPATTGLVPATTSLVEETTNKPKEPTTSKDATSPCETEAPTPGETLASTKDSDWLVYVLIALAVIVAIMGVTIFILIWQLYKNHRFYKLKTQQMVMTQNIGTTNEAHDNTV